LGGYQERYVMAKDYREMQMNLANQITFRLYFFMENDT